MTNGMNRVDVAVFIDFENVYVSVRDKLDANPNFESIMDRCADLGRVVIARAYADWYRYPRVTSALYANGIEPMYVPTYYYDREMGRTGRAIKNSVDIHICIDAMKTLFTTTNIAKFVLVTGDRDFIPLVNSIRQQGKEVIVIGIGGAASAHLAQSADEFIFYEQLVGQATSLRDLLDDRPKARLPDKEQRERVSEPAAVTAPVPVAPASPAPAPAPVAPAPSAPSESDAYDMLAQAVRLARKRNYVSTLGSLKLLMKELMGGDFRENKYRDANGRPFAKFKDFVLEAERRGKVQVFTSGTVNEVFLPGEDPQKLSQFASILTEEQPSAVAEIEPEEAEEVEAPTPAGGRSRRRRRRGPRERREGEPTTQPTGELEEAEEAEFELEQAQAAALATLDGDMPGDTDEEGELGPEELIVIAEVTAPFVEPGLPQELDVLLEDVSDIIEDELAQALDDPEAELAEVAAQIAEALDAEPDLVAEVTAVGEHEIHIAVAPEAPAAPTMAEQEEQAAEPAAPEFSDEEWLTFRSAASSFEKAVSFSQIFGLLRDLRNQKQINRTNADLEAMLKQAINEDLFERSGRGARITYRLRAEHRVE